MPTWHLITGEYPPAGGGVADYSQLVAHGLARAGDEVRIWTSGRKALELEPDGVTVHRMADHFGPRGLAVLSRELGSDGRLLVQYVPHAFGAKAMNLPFCAWLFARRNRMPIDVMFHEVAFPVERGQPLRHNFLGRVTRIMAMLLTRAASRIFVATSAWEPTLRMLGARHKEIRWLPVPSNVPVVADRAAGAALRARYASPGALVIGHFGTYGDLIAGVLAGSLPQVMHEVPAAVAFLLGRNSCEFRDRMVRGDTALAPRVHAFDGLPVDELSRHLSACEVMLQHYPDGVSTRRTSAMAVLAHGLPMVTTSGDLTEPIWAESSAVRLARSGDAENMAALAIDLAHDAGARLRMGCVARKFYNDRFALSHTIAALRGA
jgi:hypothetical protein